MIGTTNAGFSIIAVIPSVVASSDELFVTGVSPRGEYVTWAAGHTSPGPGTVYSGGHYFMGPAARRLALTNMVQRAGFAGEFEDYSENAHTIA